MVCLRQPRTSAVQPRHPRPIPLFIDAERQLVIAKRLPEVLAYLGFAPNGREPGLPGSRQARWAVVMADLYETGCGDVIAPGVEIEEAGIAIVAKPSSLFPLGFEENSTPRGFNALNSSSRTRGNSWLGTWNRDALAKTPSKRLSGNCIARKSRWRTSHCECKRAMATNCCDPSSPTASCPKDRK